MDKFGKSYPSFLNCHVTFSFYFPSPMGIFCPIFLLENLSAFGPVSLECSGLQRPRLIPQPLPCCGRVCPTQAMFSGSLISGGFRGCGGQDSQYQYKTSDCHSES